MRLRLAVVVGITGLLAGCGAAGAASPAASPAGGSSPAGGGSSVQQQARVVWLDYARCVRSHGFRDFPDPRVDSQGKPDFGASPQVKSEGQQAQGACGSILSRLPAAVTGQAPVTAAELHAETLFAGCLRWHGLPDWPDPRPDGTFRLAGTPYANMGKTGPVLTALQACRAYDTFGGIRGSSS